MANHKTTVWLVQEREGPSVIQGFTTEEDANSFFNWEVAQGRLEERYYTVRPITVEDCSRREV